MAEARILYLGTENGLIQLANPGKSDRWREVGRALDGQLVHAVVASPRDPLLVFAASDAGISRSINGGLSWKLVRAEPIRTLSFGPGNLLYAGTERGTILSTPDGDTWRETADASAPIIQLLDLDDDTLLSIAADGMVCRRSLDRWVACELHVPNARGLAASQSVPHTLYIVNATSLVTPYGTHRLPAPPTGALLMLRGLDEVLLVGTETGLLRSPDGGNTLETVAGAPEGVTVLTTPPRFIDQVFAGTTDGALWFSNDRGRSWTQLRGGDPPIHSIAFARAQ
jgi:hypothetical protein